VRLPKFEPKWVFLNIPYDREFEHLYVAYIVALNALDLRPKTTLGIPSGERRLDRILTLIATCKYSVHDLSRVQLDRTAPRTPRFNMPFELGLAVAWSTMNPDRHNWIVCETQERRLLKSLSDINGTDPHIHQGTVKGLMREMCNAFVAAGRQPNVPQMMKMYRSLREDLPRVKARAGASSLFEARVFSDLCYAAATFVRD
jgi:hypothetical protein